MTPRCVHHWKIGRQDGKYSWGACGFCQSRRLFRNSWPNALDWPKERRERLVEERRLKRKERRSGKK